MQLLHSNACSLRRVDGAGDPSGALAGRGMQVVAAEPPAADGLETAVPPLLLQVVLAARLLLGHVATNFPPSNSMREQDAVLRQPGRGITARWDRWPRRCYSGLCDHYVYLFLAMQTVQWSTLVHVMVSQSPACMPKLMARFGSSGSFI